MPATAIKHIDEQRLERDLAYRFAYLAEFIGVGPDDLAAIRAAGDWLAPIVPQLVDAVYEKLFSYDATKRHFLPKQAGYDGPLPSDLESLALDHELIAFRKAHLARYLSALVTRDYNDKMIEYLDMVGKIHTNKAGNPSVVVPLTQMHALLGFVADALTATILDLGLPRPLETRALRAFGKLLWIQNDLIDRHYLAA